VVTVLVVAVPEVGERLIAGHGGWITMLVADDGG
jgi:hypothetical protein